MVPPFLSCAQVNNIPQVNSQRHFRALIKAQNIPHPSYDIDGDGVVGQEDYALAKVTGLVCFLFCVLHKNVSCAKGLTVWKGQKEFCHNLQRRA